MKLYDVIVKNNKGEEVSLKDYEGKVLVIVNTATGCGFTPQYKGLEDLYQKYNKEGLEILDFPCNQFGHQAPGEDNEIHEFCTAKYHTTFPRFTKIDVNGDDECEVFTICKEAQPTEEVKGLKNKAAMKMISKISTTCKKDNDIKWNFTKFIVDREGNVVGRYAPTSEPIEMEEHIKGLL